MAHRKGAGKRNVQRPRRLGPWMDPYLSMWVALAPAERLIRSWRLRSRVKNLQALHDAKSIPRL